MDSVATQRIDGPQDHVWSTAGLAPGVKMNRWTDLVSENMTEMIVDTDDPENYAAHWRQFALGEVDLNFILSGTQRCWRSAQMIRPETGSTYELVHIRTGRMVVLGKDFEELVPAGGFTLLQNDRPYEFRCLEPTEALTAHFDDNWLRRWLVHRQTFTHAPIEVRRAWGAPLAALLRTISHEGLQGAALPRSTIADQIGALFALMSRPAAAGVRTGREALLARLRGLMREGFEDPELSPQILAKRAGVSKRYVHKVFANAGTTFGQELIELRLNRAKQMLADPRYVGWTIAQVAMECGFSDQSHFSRRFRGRYGIAPSGLAAHR